MTSMLTTCIIQHFDYIFEMQCSSMDIFDGVPHVDCSTITTCTHSVVYTVHIALTMTKSTVQQTQYKHKFINMSYKVNFC